MEAYDTHPNEKRPMSLAASQDFTVHVNDRDSPDSNEKTEDGIVSTPTAHSASRDTDILYRLPSVQPDDNSAVNAAALSSYIHYHYESEKPAEHTLERQYTARLDDLLESTEKRPGGRRYSLYGDYVHDPSLVNANVERFVFYSANMGTIKSVSLRDLLTKYPVCDEKEGGKNIAQMLLETSNWWLDIFAATDEEMRALSKIFRIHPLTTEDIQTQESREKCEIFQNYMFICFRSFNHDSYSAEFLEAVNFYIIVFKTGVLTFHFQPLPHPHNVRRRIHQLKEFIHVTPEWINYALIDDITDSFAPLIQHTELEVDSIDDLVLVLSGSEQADLLRRLGSCRKTVMQLLRLLGPKADVVRSLIKRYSDKAKEMEYERKNARQVRKVQHEVTLYLGDIQDHILTMLQNVSHYDHTLGRAHRVYLDQISIELSQAGNTTNEMINRLTFLATVVVPLNLVAGLWGMNVHVPGEDEKDLVWFFWIVMGMFVYIVGMVALGKRYGFI